MVDIPDNDSTTASVGIGETFEDTLEIGGDHDWIAVTLLAGQSYSIAMTGVTLTDTFLNLFDNSSVLVASDDDSGPGLNSLLSYTPVTSGTFYIDAAGFGSTVGDYSITVTEVAPPSMLDAIDWGTQVATNTIEVYFARAGEIVDGKTSRGWNAYEIQQAMLAFEQISNVCNVTFTRTTDAASADFQLATKHSQNWLGYFNPPGTNNEGSGVFADNGYGWDNFAGGGLEQGGYGFITLIHEFGHGMGMAHPHDSGGTSTVWEGVTDPFESYGTFDLNQGVYTVMSYNDGWQTNPDGLPQDELFGYEGTMMAFDIAMLQQKYGANTTFQNGDTVYQLQDQNASGTYYACIWDTGGQDRIAYGGAADAIIDLRTATLDYDANSGGYISFASGILGGFTIANGVVIENATAGSGDDVLTGNNARNTLIGNGGADELIGGRGRDILRGGNGADDFTFLSLLDSLKTVAARDHITDFRTGIDQIDLSAIDGRSNGTANDAFIWIDTDTFNLVKGELRWGDTAAGVVVLADRNGDAAADFSLLLEGIHSVAVGDFVL